MKNVKTLFLLFAVVFSLCSCEQDSLNPLPPKVAGKYVTIDFKQVTLELSDIENTAFRGTLRNPGNNVTRYELSIQRKNPNGVNTGPLVPLLTVNSFPYELVVTPQMIADAIGINRSDLQAGDTYRFIAYSYDADGTQTGYNNLSATVRTTESMKQGYRWSADAKLVINPNDPFNPYTPFVND